jgi:hypothetical protein
MNAIDWQDVDAATYTAVSAAVNGLTVTVCLDDEGPLWPAYYWDITFEGAKVDDGWGRTITEARNAALKAARTFGKEIA